MVNMELLNALELLEDLEKKKIILNYSYNSKDKEFVFSAKIGGEYGDIREEVFKYFDINKDKILECIDYWKKDFEQMILDAVKEGD